MGVREFIIVIAACLQLVGGIHAALALEEFDHLNGNAIGVDESKNATILSNTDTTHEFTAMPIDAKWIEEEREIYESLPFAYIRPGSGANMALASTRRHFDLLQYLPMGNLNERDQGGCGNCWVWAGTACLEISLAKEKHISPERLSIQYLNSNYNNGRNCWACCGGRPNKFAAFYNKQHLAIPWSNTNAAYVDSGRCCWAGRCDSGPRYACGSLAADTAMTASNISTDPSYRVDSVIVEGITTKSDRNPKSPKIIPKEQAISNIKDVLDQGKAVFFGYFWGGDKDTRFTSFWKNDTEETLWDEQFPSPNPKWGHALTCIGYDDTDPDPRKRYWIMLNSWGTNSNRPHGMFRMPMDLNYDSDCYWWYTFDIKWKK
jgi:C1A family cysteine protease